MTGVIEGGWDTVWLVYGVTWSALLTYGAYLVARSMR